MSDDTPYRNLSIRVSASKGHKLPDQDSERDSEHELSGRSAFEERRRLEDDAFQQAMLRAIEEGSETVRPGIAKADDMSRPRVIRAHGAPRSLTGSCAAMCVEN